jgi:tRNA pseudouridine55 synthase
MGPRRSERSLDGLLLVDKSAGPTSHDLVQRARRHFGQRRIGHAGTLDPFATGLLLLCLGRATRLVRFLHLLPKRYLARIRLGEETSTHDPEGRVVYGSEGWRDVDRKRLEEVAGSLTGRIAQVPPAFSAVRVGGRRAHVAARAGEVLELEPRTVCVESLRVLSFSPPDVEIETVVGTGTYVRALARDLGRALDCGAHLRALRRTAIGPFGVDGAMPDGDLDEPPEPELDPTALEAWRSPAAALAWLPSRDLTASEAARVRHGAAVPVGRLARATLPELEEGRSFPADRQPEERTAPVALLREGKLVAVAEPEGGELRPRVVLEGA